jgi:hypothetical protein
MAWQALVGVFVVALFGALPATFEPRAPSALAALLARRYVASLVAGVVLFLILDRVVAWRVAWATALATWGGLVAGYYLLWARREHSAMWLGVAAILAGSCAWFIASVARASGSRAHALQITTMSLATLLMVVGTLVILRARTRWGRPP